MPIESTVRGIALQIKETNDPGAQPELFYRFVNIASNSWTLAKVMGMPQGSFGGQLVIETNAGGTTPSDTTIERLRITQNGHVGIGTATPGFPLDVNGIINATEVYKNGAPLVASQWQSDGGGISFSGGNVGIGTDTPGAILHMAGAVHTDGSLRVNGDTDVIGKLNVEGSASLHNGVQVQGTLQINGTLTATAIELNGAPVRISPWIDVVGGIAFSGGNVGIGVATPGKALDVAGQGFFRSAPWRGPLSSVAGTVIGFDAVNAGGTGFLFAHGVNGQATRLWLDGNPLIFAPLSTERMRITGVGNVGIGTQTPGAKLHVAGGGSIMNGVTVGTDIPGLIDYPWEYETVGVTALSFNLRLQSPNAVIFHSGDTLQPQMIVSEAGNVGIGTMDPSAKLQVANGGAIINGVTVGADVAGTLDYPCEYETIGVAAPNFNLRLQSPNSVIFHPGGARNNVLWIDPGGNIGHVRGARCDGSRWIDGSSLSYKTNVDPLSIEKGLATLVDLAPVIFRYKTEDDSTRHVGFIAEEVPELIAAPDRKGVSAMDIVGILTKVVQHQQQQITELYTRLGSTPTQDDKAMSKPEDSAK